MLGFSHAEWDDLPWHDQRMYVEQLNADPEFGGEPAPVSDVPELQVETVG